MALLKINIVEYAKQQKERDKNMTPDEMYELSKALVLANTEANRIPELEGGQKMEWKHTSRKTTKTSKDKPKVTKDGSKPVAKSSAKATGKPAAKSSAKPAAKRTSKSRSASPRTTTKARGTAAAKASRSKTRKAEKIPPLTLAEWITSDSNGNPKTLRRYTEE